MTNDLDHNYDTISPPINTMIDRLLGSLHLAPFTVSHINFDQLFSHFIPELDPAMG